MFCRHRSVQQRGTLIGSREKHGLILISAQPDCKRPAAGKTAFRRGKRLKNKKKKMIKNRKQNCLRFYLRLLARRMIDYREIPVEAGV
jgi:hypothetical protein